MLVASFFCLQLELPTNFWDSSTKIYIEIVPCAFSAKSAFFLYCHKLVLDPLQLFSRPLVGNHCFRPKTNFFAKDKHHL